MTKPQPTDTPVQATRPGMVNCFFLGAPKCGTSTLHRVFGAVEGCAVPSMKEPHFFSRDLIADNYYRPYVCGSLRAYHDLYPTAPSARWVMDFSPSYLVHAVEVAARILDYRADALAIAIIRDPVERAISHYLMDVRLGLQRQSLLEALEEPRFRHEYLANGDYPTPLGRYRERFGERLLVLGFEALFVDPDHPALHDLLGFLALDPAAVPPAALGEKRENPYGRPRAPGIVGLISRLGFLWRWTPRPVRSLTRRALIAEGEGKPDMERERAWLREHFESSLDALASAEGGRYTPVVANWRSRWARPRT